MTLTRSRFPLGRVPLALALALLVLVGLILLLSPDSDRRQHGSTYSRAPSGYGAWYAWMQDRPVPLERWRRPGSDLPAQAGGTSPQALVRVYSDWERRPLLDPKLEAWVQAGNLLVLVGVWGPVTAADFRRSLPSSLGPVQIETRRRGVQAKDVRLGDRFGAVIWQEPRGEGWILSVATPYLAANAYQDQPANFAWLAQLVSERPDGQAVAKVWIDEYLHGYRDAETQQAEGRDSFWGYIAQTPLGPALVQGLVIVAIALGALNRRFGPPLLLPEPRVNNSRAYVEALAAVLHQAASRDFVLTTLSKAEQERLQRELGLGRGSVAWPILVAAWEQQTGRSPAELERLLPPASRRRLRDVELLAWLQRWQAWRSSRRPPSQEGESPPSR